MKKKIMTLASICFVSASLCLYSSDESKQKLAELTSLTLANTESLAYGESGGDRSWVQPKTVNCVLNVGGGMVTASVERVCIFCAVPHSCTPVACGEVFYN